MTRPGPRRLAWDQPAPADLFDHLKQGEAPMPNQPRAENPARGVRVPDELWQAAKARAAERGETVTDAIIRALKRYTR